MQLRNLELRRSVTLQPVALLTCLISNCGWNIFFLMEVFGSRRKWMNYKAKAVPLYAIKALGGRGHIAPNNSRRRHYMGCVVSITRAPRFISGERTTDTHFTRGWVVPIAGLDIEATEKVLSPLLGIEPRSPGLPVRSQTLYWPRYPAHRVNYRNQY
jgi:hypothetical protein